MAPHGHDHHLRGGALSGYCRVRMERRFLPLPCRFFCLYYHSGDPLATSPWSWCLRSSMSRRTGWLGCVSSSRCSIPSLATLPSQLSEISLSFGRCLIPVIPDSNLHVLISIFFNCGEVPSRRKYQVFWDLGRLRLWKLTCPHYKSSIED